MKKKVIACIFAVVLISTVGLSSCSTGPSAQDYNRIQSDVQALQNQFAATQQELSSAKSALAQTQSENQALRIALQSATAQPAVTETKPVVITVKEETRTYPTYPYCYGPGLYTNYPPYYYPHYPIIHHPNPPCPNPHPPCPIPPNDPPVYQPPAYQPPFQPYYPPTQPGIYPTIPRSRTVTAPGTATTDELRTFNTVSADQYETVTAPQPVAARAVVISTAGTPGMSNSYMKVVRIPNITDESTTPDD